MTNRDAGGKLDKHAVQLIVKVTVKSKAKLKTSQRMKNKKTKLKTKEKRIGNNGKTCKDKCQCTFPEFCRI